MDMIINDIKIDFSEEITYGQDQANVTYPVVFPTVTFPLEATEALLRAAERAEDYQSDSQYEFSIGINGFSQRKVDNSIIADDGCGGYF